MRTDHQIDHSRGIPEDPGSLSASPGPAPRSTALLPPLPWMGINVLLTSLFSCRDLKPIAPAFHGFYRALISTTYRWTPYHWARLSRNLNPRSINTPSKRSIVSFLTSSSSKKQTRRLSNLLPP